MLPALLTTVLFSISAIVANKSITHLGSNVANLSRLLVAVLVLSLFAVAGGVFPGWEVFWIFFISGIVGFGFGDIGVFYALPRLGSRLCILYTQCVAAPIAGVIEWLWLGTSLSTMQVVWAMVTLIGVTIALDPRNARNFKKELWLSGTLFGLLAALGQGGGAVISRYGYDVANGLNATILPMTAAFFRVSGGVIIALALLLLMRKTNTATDKPKRSRFTKPVIVLIVVNAFAGPILGVSCYQWALAVQPSFVVLPIVALAPIVIIPMSMIWEGDKPSPTSILGACLAVAGAIFLALATLS